MANIKDQLNDQAITAKSLLQLIHHGFNIKNFDLFNHAVRLTKYNRDGIRIGMSIDEVFYECNQDYENALAALEFLESKSDRMLNDMISELQTLIESKYGKKKENPYANLY